MKRTHTLLACLQLAAAATWAGAGDQTASSPSFRLATLLRLDPRDNARLADLTREAEALTAIAKAHEEQIKVERKRIRQTVGLSNLPVAELEQYFHTPPDTLNKRDARGLAEIVRLARVALDVRPQKTRNDCLLELRES